MALADAAVSLETAVAALFLPRIAERVAARKRAAGLYDFDDMLALVRDALRGPRGSELIATLRARFKLAIVDEFQDTDPVQWKISGLSSPTAPPTRSTWSAIPSSRSTAFAGRTWPPTRPRARPSPRPTSGTT